jgi:hypothetical protein
LVVCLAVWHTPHNHVDNTATTVLSYLSCVLQVVNCVIQQKVGAGLHYNCVTHWDAKHDSSVTVKFENDSLTCVVMIFGISI